MAAPLGPRSKLAAIVSEAARRPTRRSAAFESMSTQPGPLTPRQVAWIEARHARTTVGWHPDRDVPVPATVDQELVLRAAGLPDLRALAISVGVSPKAMASFVSGRRGVPDATAGRIARALDVPTEGVLGFLGPASRRRSRRRDLSGDGASAC